MQPFDEDELLEELNALELKDGRTVSYCHEWIIISIENVIVPEEPIAKVPETLQEKPERKTDLQVKIERHFWVYSSCLILF